METQNISPVTWTIIWNKIPGVESETKSVLSPGSRCLGIPYSNPVNDEMQQHNGACPIVLKTPGGADKSFKNQSLCADVADRRRSEKPVQTALVAYKFLYPYGE